jgi:nucleotide-binding universal stress UspA family protein
MAAAGAGDQAGGMLLLCSTDGSIAGEAALRVAVDLADRMHAELTALDADTRDPTPVLLSAAHATGCDLLVIGYASRSGIGGASLPGWQRRVVREAPCPVMLVPAGSLPTGGGNVVLGYGVPELPHAAARVAGRLAGRLRSPLIITHVLPVGAPAARPTGWQLYHQARVLEREAESGAGGALRVRHVEREGHTTEQLALAATKHEAALVVIGGRGSGRGLMARRGVAAQVPPGSRLPIVIAAPG